LACRLRLHRVKIHEPRSEQRPCHSFQRGVHAPIDFGFIIKGAENIGNGLLFCHRRHSHRKRSYCWQIQPFGYAAVFEAVYMCRKKVRIEPIAQKAVVRNPSIRANQNHALPKANLLFSGYFSSDTKVCSFSAVKKVSITWFCSACSLAICLFGDVGSFVYTEKACPNIL